MRGIAVALTCGVYGLVLSSCGSSSKVDPAAKDLAGAVCDLAFRCCTRGELNYMLGPYVFGDDCADRMVSTADIAQGVILNLSPFVDDALILPNLTVLDSAVTHGRTIVKRDGIEACLDYIQALQCATIEDQPEIEGCVAPDPPLDSPCALDKLFEGKGAEGDDCFSPGLPIECKPGLSCRTIDSAGLAGSCVKLGVDGDPCFSSSECWQPEFYCSQLDGRCRTYSQVGETCLYADRDATGGSSALLIECEPNVLSCDPLSDTCVAVCQRGAGCGSDEQCDEEQMLSCILNRCDLLRGEGGACGVDDDCLEGLRCEPNPAEPDIRVCIPKISEGSPCPSVGGDEECVTSWCNVASGVCANPKPAGSLCPDRNSSQCANGYCQTEIFPCVGDADCLASGECNTSQGRCEFFCQEFLPDGSPCTIPTECASGTCVIDTCMTLPLPDGSECLSDSQCESEHCTFESPRVCATLPLADGRGCYFPDECESGICYATGIGMATCNPGLPEGQPCGPGLPPCALDLYCDSSRDPAVCIPRIDAGEECDGSFQCRGDCVTRHNRSVCDLTPPFRHAICDGML